MVSIGLFKIGINYSTENCVSIIYLFIFKIITTIFVTLMMIH